LIVERQTCLLLIKTAEADQPMNPEQQKLAGEYEDRIAELRRKIVIWQSHMSRARPTDAGNLQDQIAAADREIIDLEARKIVALGELL
jgi:hypothetical protein